MFGKQKFDLAIADTVLSGTGASQGKRPHYHAFVERFRPRLLFGIIVIDDQAKVKVSVTHVAGDRSKQSRCLDVGLGLSDAFSQSRYRYANIRRPELRLWTHCLTGIGDIVTRLPETVPLLSICGPLEVATAELRRDLAQALGLFYGVLLGAVELEKQGRRDFEIGF